MVCGARAYNGGLGAEPPAGSCDRAGQGVRGEPPETKKAFNVCNGNGKFTFYFMSAKWSFIEFYSQLEILSVEHGICPIAEFTSPLLSCAAILAIRP